MVVCKENEGESHNSCSEFRAMLAVTADNQLLPQGLSVGCEELMAEKGICQLFFHSGCRDYRNTAESISDPGLSALAALLALGSMGNHCILQNMCPLTGFLGGPGDKESACNAGDPGSIHG